MEANKTADAAQLGLLLGMGGLAGAASFRHVHDLAAAHGQTGWFAWAAAVSIEAMSLAAGLEIRRAHRHHRSAAFPACALIGGVGLSLAAQVARAEPTAWGWILAAVPAAAFLVVLKFALRRLDAPPAPTPAVELSTADTGPETTVTQAIQPDPNPAELEASPSARASVTDELAAYLSTH